MNSCTIHHWWWKVKTCFEIFLKPSFCKGTSIWDLSATSRSVSMIVQFLMNSLVCLSTYHLNISTRKWDICQNTCDWLVIKLLALKDTLWLNHLILLLPWVGCLYLLPGDWAVLNMCCFHVQCTLYMCMPVYALLCDISSKGHGGEADKWFQHHPPWKKRYNIKYFQKNLMLLVTNYI